MSGRLALLLASAALALFAGQEGDRQTADLAGAWRLSSWEHRAADGSVTLPFGETPGGQLVYTTDGRMSVHLLDPARPPFASGEFLDGSDEEVRTAFEGYFGYFGSYSLRGDPAAETGVVTHHVEGSAFPNYAGIDRVWRVRVRARRLTLESAPDPDDARGPTYRLVWKRVP